MEDIRGESGESQIAQIKDSPQKTAAGSQDDVLLVAVSKTRTPEEINIAIDAGVTDIGENKVQEIMDKYDDVKACKMAHDRTSADK